jgi:hypothetical protein
MSEIEELKSEITRLKEIIRQLKELVLFTEISAAAGLMPVDDLKKNNPYAQGGWRGIGLIDVITQFLKDFSIWNFLSRQYFGWDYLVWL